MSEELDAVERVTEYLSQPIGSEHHYNSDPCEPELKPDIQQLVHEAHDRYLIMSSGRGGYKGQNYDPNYRHPRDKRQSYDSRSSNGFSSYTRPESRDQRAYAHSGYGSSQRPPEQPSQSRWDGDNGYAPRPNQINSAPSPSTVPMSTPTGPASARSAPLPFKPTPYDTSSVGYRSQAIDHMSNGTPGNTTYTVDVPDWGKEDGEISSAVSVAQSSPSAPKVHPSRLGLIPHLNPGKVSVPNGSTTSSTFVGQSEPTGLASTSTMASGPVSRSGRFDQSHIDSLQRNTRPTPLTFTSINDPSTETATATAPSVPNGASASTPTSSQIQSPSTKSPLDSLEKLRRFKEQVAASRRPNSVYTNPEMSQIASMAAKFLKSQDNETSERAFEQLQEITGGAFDTTDAKAAKEPTTTGKDSGTPANTTPAPVPSNPAPDRPSSRQTELKERLLALKAGSARGSSLAPRTVSASGSIPASPVHASGPTSGHKRPPSTSGEVGEDTEQKRFRAAAWQRANEQERNDQQQREAAAAAAVEAEATANQSRESRPRAAEFFNVHREGMESSGTSSRGTSPPRGPRDTGHARPSHAPGSLQDRLGDRHPQQHGYPDRFGN